MINAIGLTRHGSNVRFFSNKGDNLDIVLQQNAVDFAGITQTWLNPNIPDSSINISGYNLIRKDGSIHLGSGVCAFVISNIRLHHSLTCAR